MTLYVYAIEPIDDWSFWTPLDELFQAGGQEAVDRVNNRIETCSNALKALHWEGDFREGPFVSALPDPDTYESDFIVAFKHDNNGTTFVISPRRLEWLVSEFYGSREVRS